MSDDDDDDDVKDFDYYNTTTITLNCVLMLLAIYICMPREFLVMDVSSSDV